MVELIAAIIAEAPQLAAAVKTFIQANPMDAAPDLIQKLNAADAAKNAADAEWKSDLPAAGE